MITAKEAFKDLGFSSILVLHIKLYCDAKKIEPSILIKKLKKKNISIDQALKFSFNGFRNFCDIADFVMKEE